MEHPPVTRRTLTVEGTEMSSLTSGQDDAPPLVMVHGTFWSRVWAPILPDERFRDPDVREATTVDELLEARTVSTRGSVHRTLSAAELADYLSPWHEPTRVRSWTAMDAAADPRYTLDLVPTLHEAAVPTRLVWGRDDDFQKIRYAHRYVAEIPGADLVEVHGKHIPTEDSPREVTRAIHEHLVGG